MNNEWHTFSTFYSVSTVQKLLQTCYEQMNIDNAKQKSYENSYTFVYYLQHAESFYTTTNTAPLSIKPILLFYGMIQLLKAGLLTVDATYPNSSSLLAHGVTTRKRKKQDYDFFQDEVKIQKSGLFTYSSEKLFHVEHLTGEKFQMKTLFEQIQELYPLFQFHFDKLPSTNLTKPLPEINTHYLLLYNLSMIARYETEWWYDFLHTYSNKSYPFIIRFLTITSEKVPKLLSTYFLDIFGK